MKNPRGFRSIQMTSQLSCGVFQWFQASWMCCQEENTHWNGSSEMRFYFRKALIGVSIDKIFGMLHHLYQTSWARLWKTYFLFIHVGNLLSCIRRVALWGKSKAVGSSNCIITSLHNFWGIYFGLFQLEMTTCMLG